MSNIVQRVYATIEAMRASNIHPRQWETEEMPCEPLLSDAMELHMQLDAMDRNPEQEQAMRDLESAIWRQE